MKPRSPQKSSKHERTELRGVVKKMTGRLTNDPQLEHEGHDEMTGGRKSERRAGQHPDPHRRG